MKINSIDTLYNYTKISKKQSDKANKKSDNNSRETLAIARQLRVVALAPSDHGPQDLKVADSDSMMEARAMREISRELKKLPINLVYFSPEF